MSVDILFGKQLLALLFLNIFIYIYLLFITFLVFFLYDLRFFKSLTEFRAFFNNFFVTTTLILSFLSLAGMPPMLGFLAKLATVLFFFAQSSTLSFILFIILNFFGIYFYIVNLRHLIAKSSTPHFFLKNNTVYMNFFILYILVVLNVFNVFAVFFFEDMYLFCFFLLL